MNPKQLADLIYQSIGDEALRAKPEADRRQWVGERAKLEGLTPLGVQETVSRVEALLRDNARPAAEASLTNERKSAFAWSGRGGALGPVSSGARARIFDPRGK